MVWDFLKKAFGKKEEQRVITPPEPPKAARPEKKEQAAVLPPPSAEAKKPEPVSETIEQGKPAESKPAPKPPTDEEQIEAELSKLPPEMTSRLKDPQVREKITSLAKKMLKDGVNLKSEKQIKNWLKEHPGEAQGGAGEGKVETFRRTEPKVGRNDPCPCGSGEKYKKCCGK